MAVRTTMAHIDRHDGPFVTVLPRWRKEDGAMGDGLVVLAPSWQEALRVPGGREDDPYDIDSVVEDPWPSAEGDRVNWVRSSVKVERDAEARRVRIAEAMAALEALNVRLASAPTRLEDKVAIAQEADEALGACGATRSVGYEIEQLTDVRHRQESRRRPGKNTRYRRIERIRQRLRFSVREDLVVHGGCWPLVTDGRDIEAYEVLVAYKYQPYLERRHRLFKGDRLVRAGVPGGPRPHRRAHELSLPRPARPGAHGARSSPGDGASRHRRACSSPRRAPLVLAERGRMIEAFTGVARHRLLDDAGNLVQTFAPVLTPLQGELLDLLGVPASVYA
jgi:hypothetical protein